MDRERKSMLNVVILVIAFGMTGVCLAAPMGTAFTYQGRLIDANSVAEGLYDFEFKVYDVLDGGSQQGSTVSKDDVDVIDSYFTVELDFDSSVFTGDARWLQIGVRPGASTGFFTTLSPRQEITPAPYALYARGDGNWTISGDDMYSAVSGNVGIGTTNPAGKLDVNGKIKEYGNDLLPTGVIVMWSGDLASISQGWALCDGGTYDAPNGPPVTTPDLRGRFIYGVSAGEDPGATGGSTTHFHDYFDVPFHNHTITDPGHSHELRGPGTPKSEVKDWVMSDTSTNWGVTGYTYTTETGITVDYTGGGSPETEDASSLPPYYKLAFIMKL